MSRTNYQRGSDKERRIMNEFRKKGWIAFRSAGSHSSIDVIGIDPINKTITLVQSKLRGMKNLSRNQRESIVGAGMALNGYYMINFELRE